MNEFGESIRYRPDDSYKARREQKTHRQKTITGRKPQKGKYTAKRLRNRLIAILLAGVATIGIGMKIKGAVDRTIEAKYVSNFEEIQEYSVKAQELGIPQDLYDEIIQFRDEINERSMSAVSNQELADYFGDISEMYLNILKSKVGNIIGRSTSSFDLFLIDDVNNPGAKIMERDGTECIGGINSDEVLEYMNDILAARNYKDTLECGDINREKVEEKLLQMTEKLGEVMTINLLRSGTNYKNELVTYRIPIEDLKGENGEEKTAQIEDEPQL